MSDKPFATEAEMCAAFIGLIAPEWTAYAETAGWDILLVRKDDGCQVGVQAKLRLNADVLVQAVEGRWDNDRPGPDYRAVLVPHGGAGKLEPLAEYCGITVLSMRPEQKPYNKARFTPDLPSDRESWREDWFERCPLQRHPLPDYVPDVAAGVKAPIQLTAWKIKALKITALLKLYGTVRRADFKALRLDIRRWLAGGFWQACKPGSGLDACGLPAFTAGPSIPDFAAQHPVVFAEILADAPKWVPGIRPDLTAEAVRQAVAALTEPMSMAAFLALQQDLITADPRHGAALIALERGNHPAESAIPLGALEKRVSALARRTGNRESTIRYFLGAAITAGLLPPCSSRPSTDEAAA